MTGRSSKSDKVESKDSLVIYSEEKDDMTSIFLMINDKKHPIKEGIYFLTNGEIDYDKSVFVEPKGDDLYYHSPTMRMK